MITRIRLRSFYVLFAATLAFFPFIHAEASTLGKSGDVTPLDLSPSEWTSATIVNIGRDEAGSVWAFDGGGFTSGQTELGAFSEPASVGTVTISGDGSTWSCADMIYVGSWGQGILNVNNGGGAYAEDSLIVGYGYTSTAGSTLTATSNDTQTGSTVVTAQNDIIVGDAGVGTATFSGAKTTVTSSTFTVGKSDGGNGEATFTGRASVNVNTLEVGKLLNSMGVLNVENSDVTFTSSLTIGDAGTGTATFSGSETTVTTTNGTVTVGNQSGSSGKLIVEQSASMEGENLVVEVNYGGRFDLDSKATLVAAQVLFGGKECTVLDIALVNMANGSSMFAEAATIGDEGNAELNLSGEDTKMTVSGDTVIAKESTSTSSMTVDDSAQLVTNNLNVGNNGGNAKVNVGSGGKITINGTATIDSNGNVSMVIGDGSTENLMEVALNLVNNGKITINAGAADAGTYTPLSVGGTTSGSGTIEALGGTWDDSTYEFVVGEAMKVVDGQKAEFDLLTTLRVEIGDDCILGFKATQESTEVGIVGEDISQDDEDSLLALLGEGESILAGKTFEAEGDIEGDRSIGYYVRAYSSDSLKVWHKEDGGSWEEVDDKYVESVDLFKHLFLTSCVTDSFSSYAVTGIAIPEPATAMLISLGYTAVLLKRKNR